MDAIDGKQARRTNSSSPLGELFDHGCDSLSTGIVDFFFMLVVNSDKMNVVNNVRINKRFMVLIDIRIFLKIKYFQKTKYG